MAFHYSVLDLSPICEGGSAAQAFQASRELAQLAERWGYRRFWLAEHHSMRGIASAATSLVISHVAAATHRIRVGAGGIMLPNHSPLVIAEQFGTLETLYPGRIDLGLGRAPGSDQATARALRRQGLNTADSFPEDVAALQAYFRGGQGPQAVRAVPGEGLDIPIWILGSSLFGAQFAAYHGLPYSFASHFAPSMINEALQLYRQNFRPSAQCDKPTVMLGMNVFAAESEQRAQQLFSSLQQQFLALIRGTPGQLPP
ncbi:MAG: LLM class flavin-dependent oxidoreductase, partial [Pigmentiphaga sp.]|nr:LLM class flavin-dependent oxidoreductase [Pigmentiphaga sp.]